MKRLPLEREEHKRLEAAFREWLEITGYASTSVYSLSGHIKEFLHWLETGGNRTLEEITAGDIHQYFFQLRQRKNQRRPGALSVNGLYKHLQALKRFSHYLRETGQGFIEVDVVLPKPPKHIKTILTRAEIGALYEACESSPIGLRDRAMLGVYYGCGLRRNEGVMLDVGDFLVNKDLLYVRKGKGYRERYVPMTKEVKEDLENYLQYGRSSQLKDLSERAFFISERGRRINSQSLFLRLKQLAERAGIEKGTGLHTLRHTIATHLLQGGMKFSHIARFLGHSSLESTQIYTHLSAEAEGGYTQ